MFYYSGLMLMPIGILVFISAFINALGSVRGGTCSYEQISVSALLAILGMAFIVVGNAFMSVGSGDTADVTVDVTVDNFGDKLRELHRLYEEGILSEEEYERKKRETLDQI